MADIKHLRIASRASPLAVVQSEQVAAAIKKLQLSCEIVTTESAGDIISGSLADVGGKELFVGTLRKLLQQDAADCAVHSLKDMAAVTHADFALAAIGFAEDARDIFISATHERLEDLPAGAIIGTCSPRRAALLSRFAPQIKIVPMRGNIQTRLRKLADGQCTALILAAAGLRRLRLIVDSAESVKPAEFIESIKSTESKKSIESTTAPCIFTDAEKRKFYYEYLSVAEFIPAPGQGLLAVECLAAHPLIAHLRKLADADSSCRAAAERAFTRTIGGDCHTPLGAHATVQGDEVLLNAFYVNPQRGFVQSQTRAPRAAAAEAGIAAAKKVLS